MLKRLLDMRILCCLILSFCFLGNMAWADDTAQSENAFYLDKTKVVSQQINLLNTRLQQSKNEIAILQKQQMILLGNLTVDHVSKQMLSRSGLDIAMAKSNLDSINIELSECALAVSRLEKDVQEIKNQLNVLNIFGLKFSRNGSPSAMHLHDVLNYQTELLRLEKTRGTLLQQLQGLASSELQLYKSKFGRIDGMLKSHSILQLKERQAKSELGFQELQSVWLQRLAVLQAQLIDLQKANSYDTQNYDKLQNEIFYVNENVNFTYLQMLLARYQEQMQQLKILVTRGSSITLLNRASEQAQALGKQLTRVNDLLSGRLAILEKRKTFLTQSNYQDPKYLTEFTGLEADYKDALANIAEINQNLVSLRVTLDQALQHELSSRQGLPGLDIKAWLDLGSEVLWIPNLTFQAFKSLSVTTAKALSNMKPIGWIVLIGMQLAWGVAFIVLSFMLRRVVSGVPDHEYGHINLRWLIIKLFHRNLFALALIGNFVWLLSFFGVPMQNFAILTNLALVWLLFKMLLVSSRLCLVETMHDKAGDDVRLYHKLKWILIIGGVVTALTVFIQQLPIVYEVKDFFDRLFLLFLFVSSLFLLRQWHFLPGLILPHIDERRTYLRRIVNTLGFLIPVILLVNSLLGLCGFVNLVSTMSWYESLFIVVLVGYLILRGFLSDGMERVSRIFIRHVTNGWLWTEAFLKPLDRVLRIILFLSAWVVLFLLYGWDQQSPVVERLGKLLHYQFLDLLNTAITPLSIIEIAVIVSLLYWSAKWTREFVYRLLLSRTKDLGLRNSLAILSQYAMIVTGVLVGLRLLGIDFKALAFVATAFAFGVGLGLRDLVNNFASGFLLLLERPLRVGDIVCINGFEGEVTHIGGRAVTIRTWDHMDVLVPNAEIFSKSFTNWTGKDNIVRSVVTIKVNRHDSPHEVQAVIRNVLEHHKDVLTDPAPEVFLKEMADGLIEFEARYYLNIRQIKSRLGLRSEVLMAVWEAFERLGIQPPYPHHEVHVKGAAAAFIPQGI